MTYLVGEMIFPTKEALKQRCRTILEATPDGDSVNDESHQTLPDVITEGIRHHHQLGPYPRLPGQQAIPAKSDALIAVSKLADRLYRQAGESFKAKEWVRIGPACLKRLAIDEENIPGLEVALPSY